MSDFILFLDFCSTVKKKMSANIEVKLDTESETPVPVVAPVSQPPVPPPGTGMNVSFYKKILN